MDLITIEEKIRLLRNLLEDPDDEISREILKLNAKYEDKRALSNSSVISSDEK